MAELNIQTILINYIVSFMLSFFYANCWSSCLYTHQKIKLQKKIILIIILSIIATMYIYTFPNPLRLIIVFLS